MLQRIERFKDYAAIASLPRLPSDGVIVIVKIVSAYSVSLLSRALHRCLSPNLTEQGHSLGSLRVQQDLQQLLFCSLLHAAFFYPPLAST